jgi:hypothetical protein
MADHLLIEQLAKDSAASVGGTLHSDALAAQRARTALLRDVQEQCTQAS